MRLHIVWCLLLQAAIEARPLLFGSFMAAGSDERPLYAEVPGYEALRTALDGKLAEYNESNPNMDMVLFQQVQQPIEIFHDTVQ